jgi:hypothetical protein
LNPQQISSVIQRVELIPANCNRGRRLCVVRSMTRDDDTNGEPIELDAGYAASLPGEAPIAAAFRSGLAPDEAQTRRLIAGLPGIQDRARRLHRRRQALTSGLVAVAASAAVFLVATMSGTPTASIVPPAGKPSPTVAPTPSFSRPHVRTLRIADVTVFGNSKVVEDATGLKSDGGQVISGVCVDGVLRVDSPSTTGKGGWRVADPPAGSIVPPRLVERIWEWEPAGPGSTMLDQLEAQIPGCAAKPGLEGRGPTSRLEAPAELAAAERVLVTTASDGLGNQEMQVMLLVQGLVIQLQALIPDVGQSQEAAASAALRSLTPTAQAAIAAVLGTTEDTGR